VLGIAERILAMTLDELQEGGKCMYVIEDIQSIIHSSHGGAPSLCTLLIAQCCVRELSRSLALPHLFHYSESKKLAQRLLFLFSPCSRMVGHHSRTLSVSSEFTVPKVRNAPLSPP
jgi:hypothetical protein